MARVILLAGGNVGDVKRTLQSVQRLVNDRIGPVMRCSHRYESEPWGFTAENNFENQALEIETDLAPVEVLDRTQQIERELGRNHAAEAVERAAGSARYASRTVDIDMIFYGDQIIDTERLKVPHPLLAEREFALGPINEIAALKQHPVTGVTVADMLEELRKKSL